MKNKLKAMFHRYMGRDRQWNRTDFMLFGRFPIVSMRREVGGKGWILSICKLPVLFG